MQIYHTSNDNNNKFSTNIRVRILVSNTTEVCRTMQCFSADAFSHLSAGVAHREPLGDKALQALTGQQQTQCACSLANFLATIRYESFDKSCWCYRICIRVLIASYYHRARRFGHILIIKSTTCILKVNQL